MGYLMIEMCPAQWVTVHNIGTNLFQEVGYGSLIAHSHMHYFIAQVVKNSWVKIIELFLVLAVNSDRFQILWSYTLLLKPAVLMRFSFMNSTHCHIWGQLAYCQGRLH